MVEAKIKTSFQFVFDSSLMGAHWTFVFGFAVSILAATVLAQEKSTDADMPRQTRSFPYSMPFIRMLRPQGGPNVYVPARQAGIENYQIARELSELIDSLDQEENLNRQRRDDAVVYKRYACRFKFCRIFDA
ncbi:hypothetical protein QR680_002989 [Steinernema hermaphroditum]|uniref:Uncharacterized protein n=1 Tax=Steinernema hermaphroditum TaxID=289476 RepID=A0AA39LJ84_9BILA|nr:hypothetical protein QR680_002989 [Steinernema hermaphroditum]